MRTNIASPRTLAKLHKRKLENTINTPVDIEKAIKSGGLVWQVPKPKNYKK